MTKAKNTKNIQTQKPKASKADKPKEKVIDLKKSNASALNWPTDKWGLCRAIKKELIAVIQSSAGHPDKMKLLDEVLAEAMEFKAARNATETKRIKELREAAEAVHLANLKAIEDAQAAE